jgi:sulfatase maturation enzyme AslB (radical SAM superfamily)
VSASESPFALLGPTLRITSLLIKPASAVCNLDCGYCFYLDREADPYKALPQLFEGGW